MMRGGIKAVRTVISYFSNPRIPKVHITPIHTTINEMKVARKDLKNKKKIKEVTPKAKPMKRPISSTIF